jgi:transcriptional repressor NrdR
MTTFERVEEIPLYVLKRGGAREVFSPEKLRRSIELAFRKRRFDPEQIEELVRRVEASVRESNEREVTTSCIGECVLAQLRDVEPVAYVRFASVYRAFEGADDFVAELQSMGRNPGRRPEAQASSRSLSQPEGTAP